jgi:hypothetical protein
MRDAATTSSTQVLRITDIAGDRVRRPVLALTDSGAGNGHGSVR